MKKLILPICAVLLLSSCGVPTTSETEVTNVAEYKGRTLELLDAEFVDDKMIVHAIFTNDNEEPIYAESSFAEKAYQNDVEIDRDYSYQTSEKAQNLTREVKNGKSLECEYAFILTDESEVEVSIYSPTADEVLLARKVYKK